MGNDESHFTVSLIVRDKITRQCPLITTFEEKGEPKRNPTEVPVLTSLTPYRWAKPAHRNGCDYDDEVELHVFGCRLTYEPQTVSSAEAWFSVALCPQKPSGLLGRKA